MPGTNAGTGNPIFFRCSSCRRHQDRRLPSRTGFRNRVELTGRTRHFKTRGVRTSKVGREYKCLDCGHTGWSRHVGLEPRKTLLD